jgi:hypothetical protein
MQLRARCARWKQEREREEKVVELRWRSQDREDASWGSWGSWKRRLVRRADAKVMRTMERRTGLAIDHSAAELNTTHIPRLPVQMIKLNVERRILVREWWCVTIARV